jgi:hypothetical protein
MFQSAMSPQTAGPNPNRGGEIRHCYRHSPPSLQASVTQGMEQQPSKLKVAGSNPAGVANEFKDLCQTANGAKNGGLTPG